MDNNKKQVRISTSDKTSAVGLADALMHDGVVEGKAKIILTNEKNGKREIIEHKNLVTNAVRRIYQNNWIGSADVSALMPMEKLFGGILCFRNPFVEATADTIYCPSEGENPMVACAGDEAHSTLNPYRGNPSPLASSIASDLSSMTKVWEWQSLQGVGTIQSLCLTSAVCGNMGLKPIDGETRCPINTACNVATDAYMFTDENQSSTQVNTWTLNEARRRPLWVSKTDGRFGYAVFVGNSGASLNTTFSIVKVENAFLKTAMFSGIAEYRIAEQHDFSENLDSKYIIVDDDDYIYFVKCNGSTGTTSDPSTITLSVIKVSKTNWTVSSATYDITSAIQQYYNNLLGGQNVGVDRNAQFEFYAANTGEFTDKWRVINGVPFENGCILLNFFVFNDTATDVTRMCWIPITHNPSYAELKDVNVNQFFYRRTSIRRTERTFWSPNSVKLGNGLYLLTDATGGFLINDSRNYRCGAPTRPNGLYTSTVTDDPEGIIYAPEETYPAMMFSTFSTRGVARTRNGFCHSNFYLATINSLEEPVEKSNVMSMRIEYTISVV